MASVMLETAFGDSIMRGINDPQKLFVADFAFQGGQFILQFLAESLHGGQKGVAIGLQLDPDGFAFGVGGRVFEFGEKHGLLDQVFVTSYIKADEQGLNCRRDAFEVLILAAVALGNHDDGGRGGWGRLRAETQGRTQADHRD